MAIINFYHAQGETPGAVDALLPPLLEKALSTGLHAAVVCPTPVRAQRLDETLWTYADASFLPHAVVHGGAEGGGIAEPASETHPVILLPAEDVADPLLHGRLPLVLAGAESVLPAVIAPPADKVFYLFSAAQTDVERARALWKDLKAQGHALTYWQKTEKGWEKKA